MQKQVKKIAFLFGGNIVLHFVAACTLNCDCPSVKFPFFDYQKVTISHNPPSQEKFQIYLNPDSITFLVDAVQNRHFNFISEAYGCDCASDGFMGDKFNITALDISTDKDFDDTHPATLPLNDLFSFHGPFTTGQPLLSSLPAMFGFIGQIFLETTSKPKNLDQTYRFTVEITKSNGQKIVVQTDEVHF